MALDRCQPKVPRYARVETGCARSSSPATVRRVRRVRRVRHRVSGALFVAALSALSMSIGIPKADGATPTQTTSTSRLTSALMGPMRYKDAPSESGVKPALTPNPTCIYDEAGESLCVHAVETDLQFIFDFDIADGTELIGSIAANGVDTGTPIRKTFDFGTYGFTYSVAVPSDEYLGAACAEAPNTGNQLCENFDLFVPGSGGGYRLSAANGRVFGAGNASVYGSLTTSPTANPVVGIASTPDGKGYWEATRDGGVAPFGDARNYDDLPGIHVRVDNIVAIAPTSDGKGYWLVGGDGGEFAFGDAGYHGSLPGLHIHVDDIVGMVATPNGQGYLLVGKDGGVFVFGGVYHGSLPGLHIRVSNIVGILPTGAETGYVLVGSDGGSFVFGTGSGFYGSLPGRHIHVSDIVGIALTPDQHGYWMAGANATVYNFGDASYFGTPAGATSNQPITGIAGT